MSDRETGGTSTASPTPARGAPWSRGPRLRTLLILAAVVTISVVLGAVFADRLKRGGEGLRQLAVQADHDHGDTAGGGGGGYFTCGMHPWVILPAPGLCPICHMDLTPLDPAKLAGEIAIDPVIVQNIGVRIGPVVEGVLEKTIRTVGSVGYDETTLRVCNTKVGGWIEDLIVESEGAAVTMGEPLFTIYSPELYAAQEEYLLAFRARESAPAPELLESARTRLRYLDVTDEQIAALEARGQPTRTTTVLSPHSGIVVEKLAEEGARVEAGMPVYRVADLGRVWVNVALYEHQAPFVRVGQPATMTLPFLPGKSFEGSVAYVYPYLDASARQLRVRLAFDNRDGTLKPGMFANVELRSVLRERAVLAPREAILSTGTRAVAFVSVGEGRFEPRTVRTGAETADGRVEVLEGVAPGEMVVTSGQFLLDSESKMRTALAKMVAGDTPGSMETHPAPATGADASPPVSREAPEPPEPMADGYPLSTCVVTGLKLGAMGDPVVIEHEGRTVKFCCSACPPKFRADPARYLEKLDAAAAGHGH